MRLYRFRKNVVCPLFLRFSPKEEISESGTHQELMERDDMYAEMYGKQAAWMT